MAAFIQDLLGHYAERKTTFDQTFRDKLAKAQRKLPDHLERAQQLASLVTTWELFLTFAVQKEALPENAVDQLRDRLGKFLVTLAKRQDKLHNPDRKTIFLNALRDGLRTGQVHLVGAKGGTQPLIDDPTLVGWDNGQPKGARLGWYEADDDLAYIQGRGGEQIVEILLGLIPLPYRGHFVGSSRNYKAFWTKAKDAGILSESDARRNTVRKTLPGARPNQYQYLIQLGLKASR